MKGAEGAHESLDQFCHTLIQRLREYSAILKSAPQTEKELECNVLWRVIDEIGSRDLDVRRHPWGGTNWKNSGPR